MDGLGRGRRQLSLLCINRKWIQNLKGKMETKFKKEKWKKKVNSHDMTIQLLLFWNLPLIFRHFRFYSLFCFSNSVDFCCFFLSL